MIDLAAQLYAVLCGATVCFQIALIAGAPWGPYTQGGQHAGALPRSGRIVAAVSIGVLVFMAAAILSAAGLGGWTLPRWTAWAALAVTALSMILNWITPSRRERAVWGPFMTFQTALAGFVMVFTAP